MIVLSVASGAPGRAVLDQLRLLALRFPGDERLVVECAGRRLTFGDGFTYDASSACMAAMAEFGEPVVLPSSDVRAGGLGAPPAADLDPSPAEEG